VRNIVVQAAYVGNRGVWENSVLNNPDLADYRRVLPGLGLDIANANDRTLLNSAISSAAVRGRGFNAPYTGYPGTQTLANVLLRPYPQYTSVGLRWAPQGRSWYDSLQAKVTKRYSHGLSLTAAFTWSKTQSMSSLTDFFNLPTAKGLSLSDRPFIFNTGF